MECARPRAQQCGKATWVRGNPEPQTLLKFLRPRTAALRKSCTSILQFGKRRETVSRAGTSSVEANKFRAPKNQRGLRRIGQILIQGKRFVYARSDTEAA